MRALNKDLSRAMNAGSEQGFGQLRKVYKVYAKNTQTLRQFYRALMLNAYNKRGKVRGKRRGI